jgi:hypothetical protein
MSSASRLSTLQQSGAPSGGGSVLQFALATVPFLILFSYFLYEAARRPYKPIHTMNDETITDDWRWQQANDENGAEIPLRDMMICMTVFLCLFVWLVVYIWIFIPLRRQLMKSYLANGLVVLGDVLYDEMNSTIFNCCMTRYATVEYRHPYDDTTTSILQKSVRVYQYYTREQTTLLYLPDKPYSALPKSDIELDLEASDDTRAKTKKLTWILVFWVVFLIVSPIYVLHQMSLVNDEDAEEGWKIFLSLVVIGVAVISIGGNVVRWMIYRHWLLYRASKKRTTNTSTADDKKESSSETPYVEMVSA